MSVARVISKGEGMLDSIDGLAEEDRGMFDEVTACNRTSSFVKKSATVLGMGRPPTASEAPLGTQGQAHSKYHCTCSICVKESAVKRFEAKEDVHEELFMGEERSFTWLLEHLTPKDNEKIRGCQLLFPDTVVFHKGRVKFIARTDKEGFLTYNKQAQKMSLH